MRNKPSSVACPVQLEAAWLSGHREETQEKGHAGPAGTPPTRGCQVCTHSVLGLGAKAAIDFWLLCPAGCPDTCPLSTVLVGLSACLPAATHLPADPYFYYFKAGT